MVESQPSKLLVASSILVSRSKPCNSIPGFPGSLRPSYPKSGREGWSTTRFAI